MSMLRALSAVLVSAAVVLSAPYMGQVRAWVRTEFPGRFVAIVGGSVAAAIGLALLVALVRIRHRRALRYGALLAALLLGFAYNRGLATGTPEIDVVERVHFVEYGLIALAFYLVWRPRGDPSMFILPLIAGVIVGTVEEWFQWFIPVRVGEARDVALNLAAVTCGLLFSVGMSPPASFVWPPRRGSSTRVGVLASTAVLVLAGFTHAVHLGHVVSHEGVGAFNSRYQEAELRALAADRAARWRSDPPLTFRRLSREDQYMDEGLWHIRRRNDAWAGGDRSTAWSENRILEEFFAPVLDTPSYVSKTGHRWPPDQRAEAQGAAGGGDSQYVSRAEPRPILVWPKTTFWLTGLAVAAALTVVGSLLDRRER
jgi:VanZ family protein